MASPSARGDQAAPVAFVDQRAPVGGEAGSVKVRDRLPNIAGASLRVERRVRAEESLLDGEVIQPAANAVRAAKQRRVRVELGEVRVRGTGEWNGRVLDLAFGASRAEVVVPSAEAAEKSGAMAPMWWAMITASGWRSNSPVTTSFVIATVVS